MSAYRCLSCGVSERRVPAREAELIRGGWLNLCGSCAADTLAEQVAEIVHSIRDLTRDADDYAAAGLLSDGLEAWINALADVAKSFDACWGPRCSASLAALDNHNTRSAS